MDRKLLPFAPEQAIFVCLLAWLVGCASSPPPVTMPQILEMTHAGVSADTIIARIKDSKAVYQLPASKLVTLGEAGVPGPVLDYMQQTHFKVAGRRAAREYIFETRMLNSWK